MNISLASAGQRLIFTSGHGGLKKKTAYQIQPLSDVLALFTLAEFDSK